MSVKEFISSIHRQMYRNEIGYAINVFLLNSGIREQMKYLLYRRKIDKDTMDKSKDFYKENEERIKENLGFLADEKSKTVYKALIDYRCNGGNLKKQEYSLNDQYFVEDIIPLRDGEIFVDCGGYVEYSCPKKP